MITAVLRWTARRLWCAATEHQLEHARFFYPPAKSMEGGYCCRRCGKTQLLLYRWQSVADSGEDDG